MAALCALSLVGCGAGEKAVEEASNKAIEKALEDDGAKDVDIDSEDGSVKIETEDGTTAYGEDLDMPGGFPSDVPLPLADRSIISATTNKNEMAVMMALTDPDLAAEEKHLVGGFEEAGYTVSDKVSSQAEGMEMLMFTATKGSTQVSVSITGEQGGESNAMYAVTQGS
ncbi:hypothetical protein [Nocardioides daphniae]|uniref:Uncharacterized protein n=1 Tax=Nocardioides daphniae TaxID=402297 RepID=A0A4P7U9B5_9ACTN|nr:hypothetical protein [Nocardioides daphniae]QCC76201.1 hypothetical protein E2C04_01475 [Nocardioides daphniae]